MARRRARASLLCACMLALLRARTGCGLYARDSAATERTVPSRELCVEPELEFAPEGEHTYAIRQHRLYSRAALAHKLPGETATQQDLDILHRIYQRDIVASQTMLEQSLSNMGDLRHVRRVMRKLVTGQPVKVVFLGGSVTLGHGPRSSRNTFVNQLFAWIQQAFPHPKHELLNRGIPAVTSSYVCPCVLDLVPPDVDLLFVEFTLNDSERGARQLEHAIARGLERMLRKLMRLPSRPGIVYVHYWAGRLLEHHYLQTAEDTYNTLLKYYGLMGVSMRDALHEMHAADEHAIDDMFRPEWDPDRVHPSCVGSRYLADLLIGHLQDLAASELLDPQSGGPGNRPPVNGALSPMGPAGAGLGPPLQLNNWAVSYESCLQDPGVVQQLVRPIKGFQWVDEGKRGPKWGYMGTQPGDVLEMDVPVAGLAAELTIGLGFLLSYEHMGQAGVECVAGCSCRRREYSFHHPYGVSLSGWRIVEIKRPPDASTCTLRVTILERTRDRNQEHKVKVTSVMITEESGFQMPWLHCEECAQ